MTINYKTARKHLEAFDFTKLFVEELGWGHGAGRPATLTVDAAAYRLTPVAELGGMTVYQCEPQAGEGLPPMPARRKIERHVSQTAFEHIMIFTDSAHTRATWHWVKRGAGASRVREHTYTRGQPGDSLLQKIAGIAFKLEDLDADGRVTIGAVTTKVAKSFDLEKVTKKFYEDFKDQHADFLKFVRGIPVDDDRAWYTSVMLNRLMFIYFIQKKGFLDGDEDYLQHKLAAMQPPAPKTASSVTLSGSTIESTSRRATSEEPQTSESKDRFYRDFLLVLFFEGFAHEPNERSAEARKLLGRIPYLNGGLFVPHDLERTYGKTLAIPDAVFARIFAFFDNYTWHLDDRPLRADNEINPDVLGYIFEKYINQKQMGAYYTKEDITGYICRNTILPFLFDKLGELRYTAVHPLPLGDIEPYIYEAVKQAEYLPTETDREHTARQARLAGIRADFKAGKIAAINDLITYNLDIEAFVQDWLAELADPLTLRAFYFECLKKLTVLDPTCGSGAFLFASMNILEPLYEVCLDRMAELAGPKYPDFGAELARVAKHPNRAYFIYKSIIVHNLYGVDIMEEAVEICKLRLFLKLVAQVEPGGKIEPLPDIDFNIRAGNTLVGYATKEEVAAAGSRSLFNLDLEQRIQEATRGLDAFREMQTRLDLSPGLLAQAKADVREQLRDLEGVLDEALANEYSMDVAPFIASHHPFHWYVQFHGIMREGGFVVIVGNPPYVSSTKIKQQYSVRNLATSLCPDIYANVLERASGILSSNGRTGMIVPLSITFSGDFSMLRRLLLSKFSAHWYSSFDNIPAAVFSGVSQHCTIWLGHKSTEANQVSVSPMYRWRSEYRDFLTPRIGYVLITGLSIEGFGIPKLASLPQLEVLQVLRKAAIGYRSQPSPGKKTATTLGFSPSARNFVSVFLNEPPCLDEVTLREVQASDTGCIELPTAETALASMVALAGEFYLWYWLVRGDGFHVTTWIVSDFLASLLTLETPTRALLTRLGRLLHHQRYEALVFKRNANKYVGNFNYRGCFPITRRADLLLFAALGFNRLHALDILNHVQRVLSINVYAGEKSIPPIIKEHYRPLPVDIRERDSLFAEIDKILAQHYGFTAAELDFIINHDIKYRMGKDAEEE